jgi:hypothetical protein
MKFIQGKPRNQWEMYCLDEHVDTDNEVRLIDLFVDSLNLAELGFETQYGKWHNCFRNKWHYITGMSGTITSGICKERLAFSAAPHFFLKRMI